MMKKMLAMILTMMLFAFGASAEELDLELEGLVTELLDGGFVMQDAQMGEVVVNTGDATVWDGLLVEEELAVGQYVLVQYNGMMTRSLPPQAAAERVGCYQLKGVVSEFTEEGFLLSGDSIYGDVFVRTAGEVPHLKLNMHVTVSYDGVMTMSLPGQVNARYIEMPQLVGSVSEKTEEGFLLTTEDGQLWQVHLSEETVISAMPAEEGAEEGVEEAAIEWNDGDTVTVFYDGISARSIPPQIWALEVLTGK